MLRKIVEEIVFADVEDKNLPGGLPSGILSLHLQYFFMKVDKDYEKNRL